MEAAVLKIWLNLLRVKSYPKQPGPVLKYENTK